MEILSSWNSLKHQRKTSRGHSDSRQTTTKQASGLQHKHSLQLEIRDTLQNPMRYLGNDRGGAINASWRIRAQNQLSPAHPGIKPCQRVTQKPQSRKRPAKPAAAKQ